MIQQAAMLLSSMNPALYIVNQVSRNTVSAFNVDEEVYELHDPERYRWSIHAWSQVDDTNLSRTDLTKPSKRLSLPAGSARAYQRVAARHHYRRGIRRARQPHQQLFTGDRLTLTGTGPDWTQYQLPGWHLSSCR